MRPQNDLDPDAAAKAIEELMEVRDRTPAVQFSLRKLFKWITAAAVLCALWPLARMVAPEVYAGAFIVLLAIASVLAALRIR